MKWVCSLAILVLVSSAIAAQPVHTSVCEVTRSPASFDGKMVRLRATVASGFETFGIRDPEDKCGVIWLTYPGGGPVASTSFGPATPNLQRPPVTLKNNRQLKRFQKLLNAEMYPRSRGNMCMACTRYEVTATMSGRLDYAGKGHGFGHMNAYDTQLVLESVSDVSAVDQSSHYGFGTNTGTDGTFPNYGSHTRLSSPIPTRFPATPSPHPQFSAVHLAGFLAQSVKLEVRRRVPG